MICTLPVLLTLSFLLKTIFEKELMKTKEIATCSLCSVDSDVANTPYGIDMCAIIYSMCSQRKRGVLCRK
jgi:hypothetical protein